MTDTQAVLDQIARKLEDLAYSAKYNAYVANVDDEPAWPADEGFTKVADAYDHAARIVREGGAA
jgi:hypothetical protein